MASESRGSLAYPQGRGRPDAAADTLGSVEGNEVYAEPPNADRTISRRPLADQIKEHLIEAILSGRYAPDSRIVELQVSRQLGTSQAPVREALRGLEALGLVEISPFRGARVRRPSAREVLEAYVVRSEIESLGARLAVPRMTPEDVDELAAFLVAMQRAAQAGDVHAVAVADASFHSRVIQLSDNSALERVWRTLEPFSRTLITLVMPGADPVWTANLHEPIMVALRAGDAEQAVAALRRHFREAESMAARLWSEQPSPAPERSPARRTAGRTGTAASGR